MSQSAAASWPSEANRADRDLETDSGSGGGIENEQSRKIRKVVESVDDDLARKAMSVVPGRELRKECTREIRGSDGSFKSRTVRGILKAFLRWAVEQLDSELVFESDEGDTLKADVPVSISEAKAKEYYARLKDIERAIVEISPDPHTAMVTLTGSSEDANGNPRCPVDHMADVQETWNPYVRRELQRTMERAGFGRFNPGIDYDVANGMSWLFGDGSPVKFWEYVTILEPHESGYAHFHVGVFTSHEIDRAMFAPVLDKHVEKCLIAGTDAHQIGGDGKAVSVNDVDPETEPEGETISNLGTYLSEYIGAFSDEEFLDRPVHELVFYAACWAVNRQRVRFSNGANKLARVGERMRKDEIDTPSAKRWDLKEIERPDGETHPPHTGGGVEMVEIVGADSVDPPPVRT